MKIIKNLNEISDELTIVDFFATWCGPCKMLGPVLEEVSDDLKVNLVKVDVDESRDLAMRFNVQSVPTVFIFKNKEIIDKFIGYLDYDEITEIIKKYI